jgi:hypothetical protein
MLLRLRPPVSLEVGKYWEWKSLHYLVLIFPRAARWAFTAQVVLYPEQMAACNLSAFPELLTKKLSQ